MRNYEGFDENQTQESKISQLKMHVLLKVHVWLLLRDSILDYGLKYVKISNKEISATESEFIYLFRQVV